MSYRMPQKNTVLHEYDKVISSPLYTKGGIISRWQENILLNQRHQPFMENGAGENSLIISSLCVLTNAVYSKHWRWFIVRSYKENKGLKWQRKPAELLVIVIMTKWDGFFVWFFFFITREKWWIQPKSTGYPVILFSLTKLHTMQIRSPQWKKKTLHDLSGKRRQEFILLQQC